MRIRSSRITYIDATFQGLKGNKDELLLASGESDLFSRHADCSRWLMVDGIEVSELKMVTDEVDAE